MTAEASWLQELQQSGAYFAMLNRMGATHRLVLRWCAYLPFEDVLRIDRKWLFGRELRAGRRWRWRLMLPTERLPQILVPRNLVNATEGYATYRADGMVPFPKEEDPIFDVVNGGPITRATLRTAVERAITLPSPASVPANRMCLRDLMRRCADR
jgi:hypothetical protein